MSIENSKACYVPLNHITNDCVQINQKSFVEIIKKILEDKSILKIGQNIKFDYIILKNLGINLENMDDTMLMSYVLRTGLRGHNLDELSLDFLSHSTQKFSEVTTIEKKKVTFDYVDVEIAKNYAAEDSDVTFRLWEVLKLELIKNKLYEFYFYIEKPLIETIALMEINGCKINNNHLTKLSNEFSEKIEIIEEKIYKLCGEKFNVGSPKQLGDVLFSKLNFPHGKKVKVEISN